MKIGYLTDTHFTYNLSAPGVEKYLRESYDFIFEVFKSNGVERIIHGGDLINTRKFVEVKELDFMMKIFIERLVDNGYHMDMIPGNHDVYYRNTNRLNFIDFIADRFKGYIKIHHTPNIIKIGNQKFMMVPWLNSENQEICLNFIKENISDDIIVIGHFDLVGFVMHKGSISRRGLTPEVFNGYQEVWSGHYHSRSTQGNIRYMGASTQFNFNDSDEDRGCYIYDTETKQLSFHPIPTNFFTTKTIRGKLLSSDEISSLEGKNVRLYVKDRGEDLYQYDRMVESIKEISATFNAILQLDGVVSGEGSENVLEESVMTTRDLVIRYMKNIPVLPEDVSREELLEFLLGLYDQEISAS